MNTTAKILIGHGCRLHFRRFYVIKKNLSKHISSYPVSDSCSNYGNGKYNNPQYKQSSQNYSHLSSSLFKNSLLLSSVPLSRNMQTDSAISDTPLKEDIIQDIITNASSPISPDLIQRISESTYVSIAQEYILQLHQMTGLPWWATISLTAFIMRTALTFPFSITQVININKLYLLQ